MPGSCGLAASRAGTLHAGRPLPAAHVGANSPPRQCHAAEKPSRCADPQPSGFQPLPDPVHRILHLYKHRGPGIGAEGGTAKVEGLPQMQGIQGGRHVAGSQLWGPPETLPAIRAEN